MLNAQELEERLVAVAIGEFGLREFEEWFVPRSWGVSTWGTPEMKTTVYALELALAEYSNGHVCPSYVRALSAELSGDVRNLAGAFKAGVSRLPSAHVVTAPSSTNEILPSPVGGRISTAEITGGRVHATSLLAAA